MAGPGGLKRERTSINPNTLIEDNFILEVARDFLGKRWVSLFFWILNCEAEFAASGPMNEPVKRESCPVTDSNSPALCPLSGSSPGRNGQLFGPSV
jgi:hypothetical protein